MTCAIGLGSARFQNGNEHAALCNRLWQSRVNKLGHQEAVWSHAHVDIADTSGIQDSIVLSASMMKNLELLKHTKRKSQLINALWSNAVGNVDQMITRGRHG